eukprot:CAMPEP_0177574296 /NCGR_PEP_ID=MMETSP0369-20130122/78969_1 /TAXON_ID=447022 ORGANISM="Scrippsiella hangoei-like, Strain SHHI-4" /NCGR_SAMPLE_ID=MMETSP0369 /ASSEMBLY_ACC=CAM_ASM_000364 /LENGTH=116 /DNA_ID=CAMNT_0019062433 /DNA_START=290 /DNA_END=640 /DNA_ORIENTATION=-
MPFSNKAHNGRGKTLFNCCRVSSLMSRVQLAKALFGLSQPQGVFVIVIVATPWGRYMKPPPASWNPNEYSNGCMTSGTWNRAQMMMCSYVASVKQNVNVSLAMRNSFQFFTPLALL